MCPRTERGAGPRGSLTLISGGAASGKSEYAEQTAVAAGGPRYYLATMQVWDEECRRRVEKHRAMRAGKGFATVECPENLAAVDLPAGSVALLECLSNLTANECFGPLGFPGAAERILAGMERLRGQTAHLIVVTNELFSDGGDYDRDTLRYLEVLAGLNRALAARADRVVEVVCGIPVVWKGEAP